ncbi:MAG TPA: DUF3137 domain-containing protein [Allosphingosinicella sp.]|nr:DUF3137 domain-containing protein [Allosphingosinicella sp.]
MFEFTADHYDEICRSDAVREQIDSLEEKRRAAVKRFWIWLLVGIALAVAAAWSLTVSGWGFLAWVAAALLLAACVVAAMAPLLRLSEDLKDPVLEGLAARAGMTYQPGGFAPPGYDEAGKALFGGAISSASFADLFHGADAEGRSYAVYEASLQRRQGKQTQTVFSGQMYALERRPGGRGVTAIVPDRGIFNFFKPAGGMERVRIEADPAFEKKFEVYATEPTEAERLLADAAFRRRLLELRQSGRVLAYAGPRQALVAVAGKDRFEPGSMFRALGGKERVRLMFDDLCASMTLLRELNAKLG